MNTMNKNILTELLKDWEFWESDDWCYEEPSEEELLTLGIRPESVMAIQERLF